MDINYCLKILSRFVSMCLLSGLSLFFANKYNCKTLSEFLIIVFTAFAIFSIITLSALLYLFICEV